MARPKQLKALPEMDLPPVVVEPMALPGPDHAGGGIRLLAWVVDLWLVLAGTALAAGLYLVKVRGIAGLDLLLAGWLPYGVALTATGGTPGRRFLGLMIHDTASGRPLGLLAALNRYLAKFLLGLLTLGLGLLVVLFRKDRRGLHDLLAGTVVVREKTVKGWRVNMAVVLACLTLMLPFALLSGSVLLQLYRQKEARLLHEQILNTAPVVQEIPVTMDTSTTVKP